MDHCVLLAVLSFHIALHVPACSGTCPPGSVIERGVTAKVKQEIVNIHNEFRRQNAKGSVDGQPKAANMLQMTWDENIAEQAQALADTCEFKHVMVKDPRFSVGQNLYTSYTTEDKPGANWSRGVQSWYDENKSYQFGRRSYDHYTQVVWATSDKVGCGYVKYRKDYGFQRLYVCHYGPGGNVVGKEPYKIGNGCENLCLSKKDSKYKRPKLKPMSRPPKRFPRPFTPKTILRPVQVMAYPPNIMPFTPKPMPYSPYSKPRPPKRMPYRLEKRPGSQKYRLRIQKKPKVQPRYKATREDALVAMILYFLIQKQAELEAAEAQAKQQKADHYEYEDGYHEDEYSDGYAYADESVPQVAYAVNNRQNYPGDYSKYRRAAYDVGKDDEEIDGYPELPPPKMEEIPELYYS